MGKLIYSMSVSLDGFIAGPGDEIDWGAPDEELHRYHNERVRELGLHLLGRRLYETMLYWEEDRPSDGPVEREFARIWRETPRVVFSTTLTSVEGNARLVREGAAAEVERLKAESAGDIGLGGAGLAASLVDLIDEYELFVNPVVLGAGKPFFPALEQRIPLELVGTRTFGSRVVCLRYVRSG
jgi:dihydrofolate reductase